MFKTIEEYLEYEKCRAVLLSDWQSVPECVQDMFLFYGVDCRKAE